MLFSFFFFLEKNADKEQHTLFEAFSSDVQYGHVAHKYFMSVRKRLNNNRTLTSDLKLAILSGPEHRMSQAEPR